MGGDTSAQEARQARLTFGAHPGMSDQGSGEGSICCLVLSIAYPQSPKLETCTDSGVYPPKQLKIVR